MMSGTPEQARILVLSDTHGDVESIRAALPMIRAAEPHCVYHLGDVASDAAFLRTRTEIPVYSLRGNCDGSGFDPLLRVDEFFGIRIFAAHGHAYHVKLGTQMIRSAAKARDCTLVLYGHSHKAEIIRKDGLLLVNPGSLSRPRWSQRGSMALIVIENGAADAGIVEV